jgi:hypothetical protein
MQRGNKLVQRITNAYCFFVKREISGALFEGGDSIKKGKKEEPTDGLSLRACYFRSMLTDGLRVMNAGANKAASSAIQRC